MSLDITIRFKEPKMRGEQHHACGSTMCMNPNPQEYVDTWEGNITHNMGVMARNIPVSFAIDGETYSNTLYMMVWRPEEVGCGCNNTDIVKEALKSGIKYMIDNEETLAQYNPANGWGSYSSFISFLIDYLKACRENPDCVIECWR